jgi:hypothetical protein
MTKNYWKWLAITVLLDVVTQGRTRYFEFPDLLEETLIERLSFIRKKANASLYQEKRFTLHGVD